MTQMAGQKPSETAPKDSADCVIVYGETTAEDVRELLEILPDGVSIEAQTAFATDCLFAIECAYAIDEPTKVGVTRTALSKIAKDVAKLARSVSGSTAFPSLKAAMREPGRDRLAECLIALTELESMATKHSAYLAQFSKKEPNFRRKILVAGLLSAWRKAFVADPDIASGWKTEGGDATPFLRVVSWCIKYKENRQLAVEACRHLARAALKGSKA